MRLREQIANGALIGMSAAFLWHFANIWRYGQHLVGEPNIAIRAIETTGIFLILVLGISNFVDRIKGDRYGVQDERKVRF